MSIKAFTFQQKVLAWFDQHGRKHLPWQQNKTPYSVWISEIMLQQTQVATVIPYFERFMQRFPTVQALANAEEDDVLHHWAGLGYYSRARNAHKAAKKILHDYAGLFPKTLETVIALPGIGPSTAGAILSLAFDLPTAILDGNVKRVLARFHAVKTPINEKKTEDQLWKWAHAYMPKARASDYTQAMMDLGAMVCTRAKPQCSLCPLKKNCASFKQNITEEIPYKKKTRAIPVRNATFLILHTGNVVLLNKRPDKGIWGGLWSLPELAGDPSLKEIQKFCKEELKLSIGRAKPLPAFRHTFTHYHLDILPLFVEVKRKPLETNKQIWYNPADPISVGLPKPIQSIMRMLP